jgi:hypothetical protein
MSYLVTNDGIRYTESAIEKKVVDCVNLWDNC